VEPDQIDVRDCGIQKKATQQPCPGEKCIAGLTNPHPMAAMFKIIGSDQSEYGPVSADQIKEWIAEGRANDQTLVQLVGTSEWKPLGAFGEFAAPPTPPLASSTPVSTTPAPVLPAPREPVASYLVPAILSTLCCCLPFGIVAIFYASQVNAKWSAGNEAGAKAAATNARLWCWISFGLGALSHLFWLVYVFAGARFGFPM
jgi:hypothetical protein